MAPEHPPASNGQPEVRILRDASAVDSLVHLEESGLFGAFEYDIEARRLSCSAQIFRRHGLDPDQPHCRFDDLWERILPGDRGRVRRAAEDSLQTGHFSVIYRAQSSALPLRWMQLSAYLLRSSRGVPQRWIGIVLDASSALVAEVLHQESRDQVTELVESIQESFIALDRDFRFTYVNRQVCEKSGCSREELIGRTVWDIFPEALASEFYSGYQQVATERVRSNFIVRYQDADGRLQWFDVHAFPTAEGIAALVRDVTELKQAREALEASEERFRRAQQAANIGAFEWDLGTNRLTWAAKVPTFTEVADADDFSHYLPYVDEADRPEVLAAISRVLGGGAHEIEVRVHPPDGQVLWFYFRAEAVFDADRKPTRVYGVAMDITDRKRADEALRTSEKLAATGRLAASIAHEINNPLEAVTNLLFLARNSESGEETAHYLSRAEEELQRVAVIVRQTLGFYRGTSAPAPIRLSLVVEETIRLFQRRLDARKISVTCRLDETLGVLAIDGEVRQIVTNLISNAMDAVESDGSIQVRLREDSGQVRLEIQDTGRGISAATMRRLFEPFFTTRSSAGTGLGLWVCRELARKNGGTVECSSPGEGRGSTFILTLPSA